VKIHKRHEKTQKSRKLCEYGPKIVKFGAKDHQKFYRERKIDQNLSVGLTKKGRQKFQAGKLEKSMHFPEKL
jgi:hypothetical protein